MDINAIREMLEQAPERDLIPRDDQRYTLTTRLLAAADALSFDDSEANKLLPSDLRSGMDNTREHIEQAIFKMLNIGFVQRSYIEHARKQHDPKAHGGLAVEDTAYHFIEDPSNVVDNIWFDDGQLTIEERADFLWLYGAGAFHQTYTPVLQETR